MKEESGLLVLAVIQAQLSRLQTLHLAPDLTRRVKDRRRNQFLKTNGNLQVPLGLSEPGSTALSRRWYRKAQGFVTLWTPSEKGLCCAAAPANTSGKHTPEGSRNHITLKKKKRKYRQFLSLRTNFPNRRSNFLTQNDSSLQP